MTINCEICRAEIEDYLTGDLDRATSAGVRAHLESCAECALAFEEIERENSLYSEFYEQTSIEPLPASWTAIRDRIRQEEPGAVTSTTGQGVSLLSGLWAWIARPIVLQQAAFALALVVVSVATTLYFVRRPEAPQVVAVNKKNGEKTVEKAEPAKVVPSRTPTPAVEPESTPRPAPESPRRIERKPVSEQDQLAMQVVRAEREYLSAIRLLDRAIERRRNELDPDVVRQYEASLALIDASIESSRRAFTENRSDLNASNFLIAAYSRKVELMQDIAMR